MHLSTRSTITIGKIGNLRMNCFLLHVLSQDRNFGIQLNHTFELSLLGSSAKAFPNFTGGCWGDALYIFVYVMLTSNAPPTRSSINQLQESYLAVLANCAPVVTKFNSITAQKLYSLFSVFASPRFLLSKERNYSKLFYYLYTIDTILQYQYQGNVQIVYSFVRNRKKVIALREMTFESAIDIAVRSVKKEEDTTSVLSPQNSEQALLNIPVLSRRESVGSINLSEKAKGKLPIDSISSSYESTSGFKPTLAWVNIDCFNT
jgi:hypothetical protein